MAEAAHTHIAHSTAAATLAMTQAEPVTQNTFIELKTF